MLWQHRHLNTTVNWYCIFFIHQPNCSGRTLYCFEIIIRLLLKHEPTSFFFPSPTHQDLLGHVLGCGYVRFELPLRWHFLVRLVSSKRHPEMSVSSSTHSLTHTIRKSVTVWNECIISCNIPKSLIPLMPQHFSNYNVSIVLLSYCHAFLCIYSYI